MKPIAFLITGPGRLLIRGERGVAVLGLTVAAILVGSVGLTVWVNDRTTQAAQSEQRTTELNAAGPLLARTAEHLIADGDIAGLRRLTTSTAATLGLSACTVSIGEGRVIADAKPGRANTITLPDRWTLGAADTGPGGMRYPFAVVGRGAGFVELVTAAPTSMDAGRFTNAAIICAGALGLFVMVYRRSRLGLAELEVVRSSLQAMNGGERDVAALQVNDRLGTTAVAWNEMLAELDGLRQRDRAAAASAVPGNRRTSGGNLESAIDAMSQGIVLVDDKMRVRFCNGAARAFLKLDPASAAGTSAAELIVDDKYREAMTAVAAGKLRRPVMIELEQPAEAGSATLRVCVRPVRRGDADSAMVIIEDVTQQRIAERARNTFINQVTHELRTPLTNIRLYAETAIEDGEGNPEIRANCLNVINQESRRLERIVSEMLSVAEMENGSTSIRRDEVYVDVVLKDLENEYQAQATEKEIALAFDVSPKLPKLSADKDKLTIALHNLIGNALKYTPAGGRVKVTVDMRDGNLVVDVADTGIGIEAAESEKIFDRFFRSADPRVGKIEGTGLGLTLAREVMRLHGGDVTVKSEINRGSTFTAAMPVAMAA